MSTCLEESNFTCKKPVQSKLGLGNVSYLLARTFQRISGVVKADHIGIWPIPLPGMYLRMFSQTPCSIKDYTTLAIACRRRVDTSKRSMAGIHSQHGLMIRRIKSACRVLLWGRYYLDYVDQDCRSKCHTSSLGKTTGLVTLQAITYCFLNKSRAGMGLGFCLLCNGIPR